MQNFLENIQNATIEPIKLIFKDLNFPKYKQNVKNE